MPHLWISRPGLSLPALRRAADWLVVLVAFSLPLSTSATSILVAVWLLLLIPTLTPESVWCELKTPAGGLPVLLFLLGLLGMAWSDASLVERWGGLTGFVKLLAIPLLIAQFRRSGEAGCRAFAGFFCACLLVLTASFVVWRWPDLPRQPDPGGVPLKDYILQSLEFTMCAAALLHFGYESVRKGRRGVAVASVVLALIFLTNVVFVVTSRTTLVIIPALILAYGIRSFSWRGLLFAAAACALFAAAVWMGSPTVRERLGGIIQETQQYESNNADTSSGLRIAFWTKSLAFIKAAPVFGHGTGSIPALFRQAAVGTTGASSELSSNPHNQTLAVAIQLGIIGAAVLWAMWLVHIAIFLGDGPVEGIGTIVVVQGLVGSLFNSFLFDFTEGWLYVFGIGIAAGMLKSATQCGRSNDWRNHPVGLVEDTRVCLSVCPKFA